MLFWKTWGPSDNSYNLPVQFYLTSTSSCFSHHKTHSLSLNVGTKVLPTFFSTKSNVLKLLFHKRCKIFENKLPKSALLLDSVKRAVKFLNYLILARLNFFEMYQNLLNEEETMFLLEHLFEISLLWMVRPQSENESFEQTVFIILYNNKLTFHKKNFAQIWNFFLIIFLEYW